MADPAVDLVRATTAEPKPSSSHAFRPKDVVYQATFNTTTQKITRFVTPIKIEFVVPSSKNAFNLNKSHLEILKLLKDKDNTLEIVPWKEGKDKFTDLKNFPANENDCNAHFDHAVDKQPNDARKIIVRHSLITNMKSSDLKFQNARLMDHMFTNKIWVHCNQSNTLQAAALGFIQGVQPKVTCRDGFLLQLRDAIQEEMTESERLDIQKALPPGKKEDTEEGEIIPPEIKLEVVNRNLGCGNGDTRIKTEAFEIRVPLKFALQSRKS
jgi:hypothetical protein